MNLFKPDSLPRELRNAITYRDLRRGENLFEQKEAASAFFVVESGRVKLVRYTTSGKMVTFQDATPGEILAEIALFSDKYPCTAVAEVNSRLIVYPKHLFLLALHNNADLAADFIAMLVQKMETLKFRLELRDIRAAHDRLLRYLHYQTNDQNIIKCDRPFKEIAADLGLTPETLSRAMAKLEKEGLITRTKMQIKLLNSSAA